VRAVLVLLAALLVVSACGKRGHPTAPGPASERTYPKTYPTQ
jgi:hypothetical protein